MYQLSKPPRRTHDRVSCASSLLYLLEMNPFSWEATRGFLGMASAVQIARNSLGDFERGNGLYITAFEVSRIPMAQSGVAA
jgi:hypothetical protein